MQESTLARLYSGETYVGLESAWQLFKHDAERQKIRPRVRFSAELLPAWYASEASLVSAQTDGSYLIKSSLAAISGNQATLPRALFREVLNAKFDRGDEAAVDFFDSFNNRYFRLYCQSVLKHSLSSQLEEDTFTWNQYQYSMSEMLANLSGMGRKMASFPREHHIQYTGLIGLKLFCPQALKGLLEDYFQADFEIKRSELEYLPVVNDALTRLGHTNCRLGIDTLLGNNTPMVGQKLQVKICPRDYQHYLSIYDDPKMINAIDHLVRSYMGVNGKYRLLIKVNSQYLPRVRLTSNCLQAFKVGISVWMAARAHEMQFVEMPLVMNKE